MVSRTEMISLNAHGFEKMRIESVFDLTVAGVPALEIGSKSSMLRIQCFFSILYR